MANELWRMSTIEPAVNALPTLCLDRAREHARRIMQGGAARKAAGEAGWLAGLPVSIKDLTDVAGVRTTYGSPLFADRELQLRPPRQNQTRHRLEYRARPCPDARPTSRVPNASAPRSMGAWSRSSAHMICW